MKHFVVLYELQKRSGIDPSGKSGVHLVPFQEEHRGKGRSGGVPVDTASPPHGHMGLSVKHSRVFLKKAVGIRIYPFCHIRLFLVPVPHIPECSIHMKGPGAVIIKTVSVPEPAVTGIVGKNGLGMILHLMLINFISLAPQKP